jgi:hypothetical protein
MAVATRAGNERLAVAPAHYGIALDELADAAKRRA